MTTAEILEKRGEKLGVLKVALNMFKLGLDEDTIFKSTGLSPADIKQLKLEHGLT